MYSPSQVGGSMMRGPSTPYVAVGCPNAEWDFGAIGTPTCQKVPKLKQLFLWDLPSFSDPFVFDLLYGHNEGVSDYLTVLKSRSAALQVEQTFGRSAEHRRETFKSRDVVYTPPGIHPNFEAVMKYKAMRGRSSAYESPPIRIDFGPVGSKATGRKLVTELPDLVKDIRFVGSLSHIRENPHFCGKEVSFAREADGLSGEPASLVKKTMSRIPALIVDSITKRLVVNKAAIRVSPETQILMDAFNGSEIVVDVEEKEPETGTIASDPPDLHRTSEEATMAVGSYEDEDEEESEFEDSSESSESLESISSAWSEKSLDYESISSGRLSAETSGPVKSTWDSTSSKNSSKPSGSESEQSNEGDFSSSSSTSEEMMEEEYVCSSS